MGLGNDSNAIGVDSDLAEMQDNAFDLLFESRASTYHASLLDFLPDILLPT